MFGERAPWVDLIWISNSRMIWLGDLNYRMTLSYEDTRTLLEENDWDALLEKDQVPFSPEVDVSLIIRPVNLTPGLTV
jgi:hypothetical protein